MSPRTTVTKFTILALAITVGTLSAVSLAQAGTINTNIKVSKSELEGKCDRSGGTFTEESDGTYGCTINYDDGSITTVSCENPNDCFGYTDTASQRPLPGSSNRPDAFSTGTVAQTPDPTTGYPPVSVTRYTTISITPTPPVTTRLVAKLPTFQLVNRVR